MVIGWIRFKKINPAFFPFVYLVTLGFLSELISYILIRLHYSNAVVYNIYSVAEALLIVWQFQRWKLIHFPMKILRVLLVGITVFWILENFFISTIHSFSSYFIISYSFLIVLLTIKTLTEVIVRERHHLLKNSIFLICLGFLLYFTYSIMIEAFWMYGLNRFPVFQNNIYYILVIINLIANLVYALAALWIPIKPKFILLS